MLIEVLKKIILKEKINYVKNYNWYNQYNYKK